jgi:hypothetical protein
LDKELENLLNLSVYDKEIDDKYFNLLNDLLEGPPLTAFKLQKRRSSQYTYYSTAQRDLDKQLYKKFKLIEIAKEDYKPIEKDKGKVAKPYRLSSNGIFYIRRNNRINYFYDRIVLPLIKNYGSNVLFTHFLYPYISKDTLLEIENLDIKDGIIYELVFFYLQNICNTIIKSLKSLDSLFYCVDKDGFILDWIFMWPLNSNPHNLTFDDHELKKFLKSTFKWNWIDNAIITPKFNENVIYIKKNSEFSDAPSSKNNNIRIVIDEKENKAVLKQNSESLYEFIITHNRYAPFVDLSLSIDIRTNETETEYLTKYLVDKCKDSPKNLLSDIRSQIDTKYKSYNLLLKDENFNKMIAEMDKNIKIKAQI